MRAELSPVKGGPARTWKNYYDLFWTIATLRYVTPKQLAAGFKDEIWRRKCATLKQLKALADLGYLEISPTGMIKATAKSVKFLAQYAEPEYPGEYDVQRIKLPSGTGERDAEYNTDALIKIMKKPDFYAVFYPEFYERPGQAQAFLIPDAAVVWRKEHLAKLVFLEVERQKPAWKEYLLQKRRKYETVARDTRTYDEFWRHWAKVLRLELCPPEEFGFSVWCIGAFKENWPGWTFQEEL